MKSIAKRPGFIAEMKLSAILVQLLAQPPQGVRSVGKPPKVTCRFASLIQGHGNRDRLLRYIQPDERRAFHDVRLQLRVKTPLKLAAFQRRGHRV
jgi:hypothetical protein